MIVRNKCKWSKVVVVFMTLFLIIGCSNKKKTSANFKINLGGISSIAPIASGGAMLYGFNDTGRNFALRLDLLAGENLSMELDNGNWNFNAVSWDGDHDLVVNAPVPLTGKVFCADTKGVQLNGSDVSLNLTLSQANCNKPEYAQSFNITPTQTFPVLEFKSCRNVLGDIITEADSDCDNSEGAGFYSSLQVMVVPYLNGAPNIADAIKGPCYALTSTALSSLNAPTIASVPAKLNIPTGAPLSPFYTVVRGYYGTEACDDNDNRGFYDRMFINGLSGNNRSVSFTWDNSGTQTERVFFDTVDPNLCSGNRGSTPFDYAIGTNNSYWKGICNPDQLDLINDGSYVSTGRMQNYILLNTINYYAGWTPGTPPPSPPPFPMIGEDPSVQSIDGQPYIGTFEGAGHSIVGADIDFSSDNTVRSGFGLFRHLGSGGKIQNLNVIFPEVETHYLQHSKVGAVVGYCNAGTITNVHVRLGRAKGFQDIGGIVGNGNSCTINQSSFEDGSVEGFVSVGGIIGNSVSSSLYQDRFQGFVQKSQGGGNDGYCSNPSYMDQASCTANSGSWNLPMHYGGIAGVCSGGSLSQVASHGTIAGYVNVGGLCGNHSSTAVSDSYSLANIIATGLESGASNAGGLFGSADWGSQERTFHAQGIVYGFGTSIGGLFGFNGAPRSPDSDNLSKMADLPAGITYLNLRSSIYSGYTNFDTVSVWTFDDDGYDLPRLQFEPPRPCSGLFTGTFAGGNGLSTDPYLICSPTQLNQIENLFDQGKSFALINDIDLSGIPDDQNAILAKTGNPNAEFNGVFDGRGFSLNAMTLNNEGIDPVNGPLGLFSVISPQGILKDFNLWVAVLNNDNSGAAYPTGSIAGINKGIISKVTSFGKMRAQGTYGSGGLVGVNEGMIIGSESNLVIEADYTVGGVAGINKGGIIYTESNASLYPYGPKATYVGGIAGKNMNGSSVNFYDDYEGINRTFEGSIIESEYRGLVTMMDFAQTYPRALEYFGQIAGFNSGTIQDVRADGKFNAGPGILYKGTWDATTADPTAGINEIWVVSNAGSTALGLESSWAVGDLAIRTSNGYTKLASANMAAGMTAGTTTIYPITLAGSVAGYNASSGVINRVAISDHWQLGTMTNYEFSPWVGFAVGSDTSSNVANNILMSDLNRQGASFTDLTSSEYDVFHQSANFAQLVYLEDSSSASGGVINTTNDYTASLFTSDSIHVGYNQELVSAVASSTITVSNGGLTFASPTPLFFHDETAIIDLAYLTVLGFDAGNDRDLYTWVSNGNNYLPELTSPENYRHFGNEGKYYQIIQGYQ